MKNIKLAAIGIVCLTLFGYIQSCSDNSTGIEEVHNLDIPEEYNDVGKLHNEGLEYIFQDLKTVAIEYTQKPQLKGNTYMENRKEIIKQASLKFCKQNKKLQSHYNLFKDAIEVSIDSKILLKSSASDPAVEQLLNEVKIIVGGNMEKDDLSHLKTQLDVINRKAANTLSEQDAVAIYCATSTAYASYQYWTKNYRKWYFALNYPEILEQYNNEELNQLQLKNGQIKTKGWWDDLWNSVEEWWDSTTDSVEEWWNDGGKEMVAADITGAFEGAQYGYEITTATAGTGWVTIIISAVGVGTVQSALSGL